MVGPIKYRMTDKKDWTTSERQILDLVKLFLSADQINLYFIQIIVNSLSAMDGPDRPLKN